MKNLCKDLRKHATKIIGCGKKVMLPMTDEENKSFHKQNFCYICKKLVLIRMIKNIVKSKIIDILLVNVEVVLIIFVI